MDSCFKPKRVQFFAKSSPLTSNQLSTEHCSNVTVLLSTAKTQRIQNLMGTLAWTDLTYLTDLSYCDLDRGSRRTSVASRMIFFVEIASDREDLAH